MADTVIYKNQSDVATLTLNDPDSGNALSPALVLALHDAVARAGDEGCRVIVIAARGDEFCCGMNLEEIEMTADDARQRADEFLACLNAMAGSPVPVIARVHGPTLGGGVGLVAACDLVVANDQSSFALPELVMGMMPALIAPYVLRRVAAARFRFLALSGDRIDANQARAIGLVDRCVSGDPDPMVRQWIKRLLRSSPTSVSAMKRLVDTLSREDDRPTRQACSRDALLELLRDETTREGLRAFSQGFSPSWFAKP